eukprot:403358288
MTDIAQIAIQALQTQSDLIPISSDMIAQILINQLAVATTTIQNALQLAFRGATAGTSALAMMYSLYTLFMAFNPTFTHDGNPILSAFDQVRDKLYNQIIWISTPYLYYALQNTLFVSRANTISVMGADTTQLDRHLGFQGFCAIVYYFFYKDTFGLGELSSEWVNMFLTALVTTVPLTGLKYYHYLLS